MNIVNINTISHIAIIITNNATIIIKNYNVICLYYIIINIII